ncbi:PTS system mannose/fructose/sorbose family transporter subunit IID [Thermococcus aggregans]|uniref:PTS system mannose/fructose/sorbose family transporter subunit IID n=1 Tax=Thermococcus aggregans TaxID=110163 RepID=A0A9E7MWL0_THEAG|nr:PTS system mannose/fructose/sorbose family transporter subunit IID [Thermococcus aggregans]USS40145.1 PTS system mannose/fructose/sorbose family transporter subunit IID [Thermococcus aggregans]
MKRENGKERAILIGLIVFFALLMSPAVKAAGGGSATITFGQVLATTILVMIAVFEFLGFRPIGIGEPLVIGALTGIIVGIPKTALVLSALLQLVYLGMYPIGGAAAPDATVATVVAVFFAKILGYTSVDPSQLSSLIAFAVPIGILSMYLEVLLARTGCTPYAHLADKVIEQGNVDRLQLIVTLGTFQWALSKAIPILLFGILGASEGAVETIRSFVQNATVAKVMDALGVAGAMMPAIGLAYLMKLMFDRSMIPWFIFGYILAAYLNMPILGIALMIIALALALKADAVKSVFESVGEENVDTSKSILSKKDLLKTYLKIAFMSQWAWNYERMQGQAYANIMKGIEKKLRKTKEELVEWMKMHNEFFNTNPAMIPFVVGLDASLEEKGADIDTIRSIKTMLMGPLAGLGDGLFWFTWRPIAFGLGASLALNGSSLGPILAVILWFGLIVPVTWKLLNMGYKYGERVVGILQSGQFEVIREIGAMLAIGIIGALGVTYINIHTPVTITFQSGEAFKLQEAIDMILPRLLPLATLLGTYQLYRKGVTPGKALVIIFVVGFVLGLVGFLSV